MIASPALLILYGVMGLALIGLASGMILQLQARQNLLKLRIETTVAPYQRQRSRRAHLPHSSVGLAVEVAGFGPVLARLFGLDLARQDRYVLRWWMALIATMVITLLSAKLVSGLTGNLVWLATPVEWIVLSRGFFNWCEARRRDKLFTQFPDALAMIVRAVRVGIPVTDSIRAVGRELETPTGPEFARLSDELAIGVVLNDALKVMAERNDLQEYRFFATALALQNQTGGGLSETLDSLADVIRKRVAVRQKGAALSAEAKMSSIVLAALPPLAGMGLWVMNSAYITLLFVEPLGQKILVAAILTLGFGIMAMRFLIRKSLS